MIRFAEASYLNMLRYMGNSEEIIHKRFNKRIRLTLLMFVVFIMMAILSEDFWFYVIAIVVPILIFRSDLSKVKRQYEDFKMNQELEFTKFMQLLIPYLKENEGNIILYNVFQRLIPRLNPSFQNSLFILMNEMVANSNDIKPFIDFAKRCSQNNDTYLNFMMVLFDFKNSTTELSVIKDLSETANDELLSRVNDVMKIKSGRVEKIPMIMAMGVILVMMPYLLSYLLYVVKNSGFF